MIILYTSQLNGNLAHLPRLFTQIKQISAQFSSKPILLDLGGTCSPSQWHCEATEGRSMFIALDAMGYHAVNVVDSLSPNSYTKLKDQVAMILVDDTHTAIIKDTYISLIPRPMPEDAPALKICLTPSDKTGFIEDWLYLAQIAHDEVGVVQIDEGIVQTHIEKVLANTFPDPTMSGVIDFVLAEAKFYQSKK